MSDKRPTFNDVPNVIGRYELVRLLGETHFGAEFLAATSTAGGMPSVARLLVINDTLRASAAAAISRLESVLALTHGALVRPTDAGSADGYAYVAFEYLPARDLATVETVHRSRIGTLPLAFGLHVVMQVLSGLRYAARHGGPAGPPTHGRIGPETVLLLSDGQVKLHLLGLAPAFGLEPTRLASDLPKPPSLAAADAQGVALIARSLINDRLGASDERTLREALLAGPLSLPQIAALQDAAALAEKLGEAQRELTMPMQAEDLAELLETLFKAELARDTDERAKMLAEVRVKSGVVDLGGLDRPRSGTLDLASDDTLDPAAAGPVTPPPDSIIAGKYKVLRVLGRGGMGNVLEVEHLDLGRRGALKLLHPQLSFDRTFAERFRREARAACKIGHRNIVDVFDFGRTDDRRLFYVMELLRGGSLQDQIESTGAFEQVRAIRILLQVCDALDAAHEVSVVHRDLKPDNIMLSLEDDGTELVRVVDFGIAQDGTATTARVTKTGQIFGTPAYMSPEQVRGKPTDHRSDIYSAGTILYELLTGHAVFEADTVIDVMSAHLKQQPVPPTRRAPSRTIHPMLDEIVLRCLQKSPDDRYQSMADLAFDLWTVIEKLREESALSGIHPAIRDARPPRALLQAQREAAEVPLDIEFETPPPTAAKPEAAGPAATAPTAPGLDAERVALERELRGIAATPDFDAPAPGPRRRGGLVAFLIVVMLAAVAAGTALFVKGESGLSALLGVPSGPATGAADTGPAVVEASPRDAATAVAPAPRDAEVAEGEGEGDAEAGSKTARTKRPPRSSNQGRLLEEAQEAMRQRRPAEAARLYQRILGRSPSNAAALAGLGQAEFELGQYGAAANHLRRAVQLNPSNNRYRLLFAGALHRSGQAAEARRQYQEVLRRDPSNTVAKRMLER